MHPGFPGTTGPVRWLSHQLMGAVIELVDLGLPWHGLDPFPFTLHHVDHYREGNDYPADCEPQVLGPGYGSNPLEKARPPRCGHGAETWNWG